MSDAEILELVLNIIKAMNPLDALAWHISHPGSADGKRAKEYITETVNRELDKRRK